MRTPQGLEWIIILVIILLLFGAKRLPEMARGVGRSMRIFKSEVKGMEEDDKGRGGDRDALEGRVLGADTPGSSTGSASSTVPGAAPAASGEPGGTAAEPRPAEQQHPR